MTSKSIYQEIFSWAYAIGREIMNVDEEYLRRLVFDIRGEETPGRFLDKLSSKLMEYKTNRRLKIDVSLHPAIMSREWHADSFYYLRSAILTGFLNALSTHGGDESE